MPHSKGFGRRADERTMRDTPLGEIVDGLLLERTFARGLPIGRLVSTWGEIVGPRLAGESAPASLDGGILIVATSSGPWGAQVRFLAEEIRRKVNERLGAEEVRKVQVVVRSDPRKAL